jgi:hypothetical protein
MKWIKTDKCPRDPSERKTDIWLILTKENNTLLGVVKWYGPWRKYCYFPCEGSVYEWDCQRDIAKFCEEETKKYKGVKN